MPRFQVETIAGEPILARQFRLIPFAQSVQIKIPALNAGVVWNRPVSLLAVYPDGEEQIIPVIDVTRRFQIILLGIAVGWTLLLAILVPRRKRSKYGR